MGLKAPMKKYSNENSEVKNSANADAVYRRPVLRKISLAAEEVLSTGCKVAGVCDLPGYPNPTGAGS